MVKAAVDNFGRLDICICNAGILRDKSFKNMTDDMWEVVNDVHLRGTYYSAKAAYDQMLEQGEGGRIIVTSSTSGLLGNFGQTNYGAAKAGIAGFARCLYLEGARYGVTVNILAPTALSRLTDDNPARAGQGCRTAGEGVADRRLAVYGRRQGSHRSHLAGDRQPGVAVVLATQSGRPQGRGGRALGRRRSRGGDSRDQGDLAADQPHAGRLTA